MKVGNEATTESSFIPSTTTEPIPTTFRRRRPKVKPLEIFDGVSITQINKRQKNVESVAEPDPIVRDQKKLTLQDVVLGTFENVNEKPKSIFTNFDKVQEALLGTITNLDKVQEDLLRNDESEFDVEPISIEQNNQIFDSEDMVGSIFDVSVPQKLEVSTTTTPEPPITTVRFAMPETTTTLQRWIPPPTEAPRPVTLAPTQPPPIPVISATFAPVVTQPPQPPQQQQPIRQQVFQPVVTQPSQPPQQQQQPIRQQVRSRVPQQRGPKNRVPKNRPLTKSEKLKQIQDRLKQLNSNGRWEKRNQRRKKLGQRVNLQEDGERFPTPVKAAALIKSETPNQESSRVIVRKRRPNKQGDNRPGQKIRRRKKKTKFGNKLGVAAT